MSERGIHLEGLDRPRQRDGWHDHLGSHSLTPLTSSQSGYVFQNWCNQADDHCAV